MMEKDLNLDGLVPTYTDGENIIYDVRDTPFSIFNHETVEHKYLLDPTIDYGRDYPTSYMDHDMYRILNAIKKEGTWNNILSELYSMDNFNEKVVKQVLIEEEYIKVKSSNTNIKKIVSHMEINELSELLKKHNINSYGKKNKLIKLVLEKIPHYEYDTSIIFEITSLGEKFLKDYEWISFFDDSLYEFEFDEFSKYLDEHDGDYINLGLDFTLEHLKFAIEQEDMRYFDICYKTKADIYSYIHDYESSLTENLKRFSYHLNPPYYSYTEIYNKEPIFDSANIDNIEDLILKLNINNLKELFNKIYNALKLEKEYTNNETCFEYLQLALNGEDYQKLNENYRSKYFENSDELYNIGRYYHDNYDFEVANDFFEKSLQKNPNQIDAIIFKAKSLYYLNDLTQAEITINKAMPLDENDARVWLIKGMCVSKKDIRKTQKCFDKSLKLDYNYENIVDMGLCFVKNNKYNLALEYFDKANTLDKTNLEAILLKAKTYIEINDFEKAEEIYNELEKTSNENTTYLIEKAEYHNIRGEYKKAIKYCDKAIKINKRIADAWITKSHALSELGEYELADECYNEFRKLNLG